MLATVSTMILVDQGRISLDEPVTTYIKDFSMPLDPRYRDITVRMLLNHSSGLPGNDSRGAITADPFSGYAAQVMEGLKYQRLKHDPGALSAYNNDGFTMIDNLVKAVTGQEYPDFVRQNILTPLGMNSSRYMTVPLPDGSYARSYAGDSKLTMYYLNVYSTGGLFSTPEELSRLAVMLMNKGLYGARRILSEQSVAVMAQDQRMGSFNPVPYDDIPFRLGMGYRGPAGSVGCRHTILAENRRHERLLRRQHGGGAGRETGGCGFRRVERFRLLPGSKNFRAHSAPRPC